MKNLLKFIVAFAIISTCYNCTVESLDGAPLDGAVISAATLNSNPPPCSDQDPQARITNNGTIPVTLEIATVDGTILHTVADLAPGNVSGYLTFAPGEIIFNIEKNTTGESDEKLFYTMNQCMSFDIEIAPDNNLTNSTPVNL
ncbi:hypothetical protein [Psychroserpens sp.]|uniref:hypothetical protein n=1 Tax=Psychroserpens sp. TaxID=2020870 RepID=UPI001B212BF1|nr:hypothetical protein [Psychroserpens sp.]MBO6606365.1 hypothetical protein [Psychroserpens sp.]MBO6632838.1 hypothetical protein [Psychroserpens sp.]MBO6653069.1 hypothetical protein [Psychroserpens sp.]MBO6680903.1 hypothetical protein [Psychroserpens sp.]MBO6750139.1 hypothetical protein [Psychroserpens sp.]